jgi:hypothetical protein
MARRSAHCPADGQSQTPAALSHARQAGRAGWVDLVHLVCLVHLVGLIQPNKPNHSLIMLTSFFSIRLDGDVSCTVIRRSGLVGELHDVAVLHRRILAAHFFVHRNHDFSV